MALLVSITSLWVAIRTEHANQKMVDANYKMVAAASWPFLQIDSSNGDDNGNAAIILTLENSGVGPAKVQSLEAFWNGKAYPTSTTLLADCCAHGQKSPWTTRTARPAGLVLRAGVTRRFLRFDRRRDNIAMWDELDRIRLTQISFRACYCSVFDECWVTRFQSLQATRVRQCPIPKVLYLG